LLPYSEINILSASAFPEKYINHFTGVVKKIWLWMFPPGEPNLHGQKGQMEI